MSGARQKHSYIPFYMDDWAGGTARMPRIMRSVYFDICAYIWDKAAPVPEAELQIMLADLDAQGPVIVDMLIKSGKLKRDDRGVWQKRALSVAEEAYRIWERKSAGGRGRKADATQSEDSSSNDSSQNQNQNQNHIKKEEAKASSQESAAVEQPNLVLVAEAEPPAGPERVVDAWNAMARVNGLSQVSKITSERAKRLKARIGEHGALSIAEAVGTIPDSNFLMGGGNKGWKANFDWLLTPDGCAKLIEGTFHNEGGGKQSGWTA